MIFRRKRDKMVTEKNMVYTPVEGAVISLEEIGDGVFSAGMLGKGCGIRPEGEQIYAPFDGKIITVADTKHAVGLESDAGIEILIHVGIDTVEMNGNGFEPLVKEGQSVKAGEPLLNFSKKKIQEAGYDTVISVIITNSDDYSDVKIISINEKKVGEPLLQVATFSDLV